MNTFSDPRIFRKSYKDDMSRCWLPDEESYYPVPYMGSVVPVGFRCYCGSDLVITEWIYYYGPSLHPTDGIWGGVCHACGHEYTPQIMSEVQNERTKNP